MKVLVCGYGNDCRKLDDRRGRNIMGGMQWEGEERRKKMVGGGRCRKIGSGESWQGKGKEKNPRNGNDRGAKREGRAGSNSYAGRQ